MLFHQGGVSTILDFGEMTLNRQELYFIIQLRIYGSFLSRIAEEAFYL